MTPDEKLKLAVGELVIRAVFAEALIEQLQKQIEELEAKDAKPAEGIGPV